MAKVYVKKIRKEDYQSQADYRDAAADNLEAAIKLFRKQLSNEGTMKEIQDRMYYTKPGDKKRKEAKIARRKALKKMYREKRYFQD